MILFRTIVSQILDWQQYSIYWHWLFPLEFACTEAENSLEPNRILLMPKYIEWEISASILKLMIEGFTVSNNICTMNNYKY